MTHGHGEHETGLATADEQPKVTDGTDVEIPTVEEKYSTVEEDRNGGVDTGGVGDDGRDSMGIGDGGASTGAGDDEKPSFKKATRATRCGEEEKIAVPRAAAAADEQPSNRWNGRCWNSCCWREADRDRDQDQSCCYWYEEPRFDEVATRYGEEEKTAVPAAVGVLDCFQQIS